MRLFTFIILLFFCTAETFATNPLSIVVLKDSALTKTNLASEVTVLGSGSPRLSIREILATKGQPTKADPEISDSDFPLTAWMGIELMNATDKPQQAYLSFCNEADSITVYSVRQGRVIDMAMSGKKLDPFTKSLPSVHNHVLFHLEPGQSTSFYCRLYFSRPVVASHFTELYLNPSPWLVSDLVQKYAMQCLYAGIMLMFALLSSFVFFLFRDKVFVYFGLLHLSFGFYFLKITGIADALFLYRFNTAISVGNEAVSAIVLSMFLFVNSYIKIQKTYPVYFFLYLGVTVLAALQNHVLRFFYSDFFMLAKWHNFTLLLWISLTIIPVVMLSKKGDRAARNLLWSLSVLFVTSLVYVLALLGSLPLNFFTRHGIQFGTVMFSLLLFYGLFEKISAIRSEKQKAQAMDELKSRFFANISHEFRTPLSLVLEPVRQVKEKTQDPADQKLLALAERNGTRLLGLVNQLLDLAKLESGKGELKAAEHNFVAFLKGITMSFESLANQKDIRLHFTSQHPETPLWLDKDKMEVIFYNLLSNAFKFAPQGGEVAVMVLEQTEGVEVLVKDNGPGIPNEELPRIFDRFFQVDGMDTGSYKGSGIGLALVRELVHLHHGEVEVRSDEGQGTTFLIVFKKGKEHYRPDQICKENDREIPATLLPLPSEDCGEETILAKGPSLDQPLKSSPLILLIEDNQDVRTYIRQQLEHSFQILEAANGREGMEIAFENLPDLVISDVMMPEKNGFEVCEELKTDTRTSHIPVILLTARAAQNEKLAGLQYGADDYLTKPFDSRELEIRIRKLIELRHQLRQKITANPSLSFRELAGSPPDIAFMKKLTAIVEKHLEDNQFNVSHLASDMGMSPTHLNRKLRALTEYSANKYIQHLRLREALKLLEESGLNVSEVACKTGFNSTAYFVKCFREHYGKTPGSLHHP